MSVEGHCVCCHGNVEVFEVRDEPWPLCRSCLNHLADYKAELPHDLAAECPKVYTGYACPVCYSDEDRKRKQEK